MRPGVIIGFFVEQKNNDPKSWQYLPLCNIFLCGNQCKGEQECMYFCNIHVLFSLYIYWFANGFNEYDGFIDI